MKLISIEFSQVTHITRLYRNTGAVYVPDFVFAIRDRYQFMKMTPLEQVLADKTVVFEIGKFADHQIDKLGIYSDGVVVSGRIDVRLIQEFIADGFEFVKQEFGLEENSITAPQTRYDSQLVVRGKFAALRSETPFVSNASGRLANILSRYGIESAAFQQTGLTFQSDPAQFKELHVSSFSIDRRVGTPFEQDLFFSTAPLKTKDHLDFLSLLDGGKLD